MSTEPSGWITPRENWTTSQSINTADLGTRIEGNISRIETGARTLDQNLATPANVGSLRQILSWIVGRIRAITGGTNWFDAPATTLATTHAHIIAPTPHTGHAPAQLSESIITGNYTLVLADGGRVISADSATAIVITIPTHATVPLPIGTQILVQRLGVGAVSVEPAGGVTLNSPGTRRILREQFGFAGLIKRGDNVWQLGGDLS